MSTRVTLSVGSRLSPPVLAMAMALALVLAMATAGAARAEQDRSPAGATIAATSPEVQAALAAALTVSGARVDLVALERPANDCATNGPTTRVEATRPIDGSSRVAVKLIGTRGGSAVAAAAACEVWAWARVRVFAQVPVAARAIRAGETLGAPAVRTDEREIHPGHVPAVLTESSVADRAFGAGQMIEAGSVRAPGLQAGQPIKVLIVSGALMIEQTGHAIPCGRGRTCAVLPSGKHVEGTFTDGRLTVQLP